MMVKPVYRNLVRQEIEQLERQGNRADQWQEVLVAEPFRVECLHGNTFEGTVRIGALENVKRKVGDLTLREGIYGSAIADSTLGDHVAVHDVKMLSGYEVGDCVVLFNIGEMTCTDDPKEVTWLEPMNENGGRRILPFGGMTVGDAYMWARYRGRKVFMQRLQQFTYDRLGTAEGCYGRIGSHAVVKNTQCLHNVVILSKAEDPTVVDGCIVLSDGVVGYGCTVEHGVVAVRFLLGEHVHLEFGLRLNDSVVGDNSTLARCEVGNSIMFPAHEQHHNNSFLIAGLIMGQSNIAAGGTIGSNHNSRTADNELAAGRGFWPGLCCSFKHPSRFASYCLLAKADYPAELDITLPFALVNNNVAKDRLEVMPAYWWMYNMYAMDRNSKKFAKRDRRVVKAQHIEFDSLAPDTAEEILHAMELLAGWREACGEWSVGSCVMEKSKRPTVILKGNEGLKAYEEMLIYYAMNCLTAAYGESLPPTQPMAHTEWVNIGGQLVPRCDMERLIADVEAGSIDSWEAIHERMDAMWRQYPEQRTAHAYHVLCTLAGADKLDGKLWDSCLDRYKGLQQYVASQVRASRQKDDANPYRHMTCWDDGEWAAVME